MSDGSETQEVGATSDTSLCELLTFRTFGQRYALDILEVKEIRGWTPPTPLPHARPYMSGMVNLRGLVLPVMDLARRLGLPATPDDPRNVIIVAQVGARLHGLLVEAVADIVRVAGDAIQEAPRTADDAGVGADRLLLLDGEVVQLLSIERLLPPLGRAEPDHAA